jgi:polysaccharide pyruvyl transferase WcaK-like protein
MKIFVINQHTNNFGDDAAGVALAHQLRDIFPNASINFIYHSYKKINSPIPFNDDNTNHYYDLLILREDFWDAIKYLMSKIFPFILYGNGPVKKTVDLIKQADVVIVSPCGANIGIYKDWIFLLRVLIAVLEGKKPIFHLNTIGKSGNVIFDTLAKFVLKRSRLYVREAKSVRELKSWGLHAEQGVDTAFSLKKREEKIKKDKDYVALIPTEFDHWHVSFRKNGIDEEIRLKLLPDVARFCIQNDLDVRIIPHLTGALKEDALLKAYQNDLIKYGMSSESVKIEENVRTFYDYEDAVRHSKLVISMRYHGIIFAIKNAIPFLSLAYENKMYEACAYSEMINYNIWLRDVKNISIYEKLHEIKENAIKIQSNLIKKSEILDRLARLPVQSIYMDYVSNK